MQSRGHDWDSSSCAHIFQFLTWYSWCPCLVGHLWLIRFCQKTTLIAWIVDTTEVSWPSRDFFALLVSCVGGSCLVESFYVLGSDFRNFEVQLTKGFSRCTLCLSFFILLLALMFPSPLPRGGALLGTLCMGVYLALCLCRGPGWPYICFEWKMHGWVMMLCMMPVVLKSYGKPSESSGFWWRGHPLLVFACA